MAIGYERGSGKEGRTGYGPEHNAGKATGYRHAESQNRILK